MQFNIINCASLTLPGHTIAAGWNVSLPEMAIISVRYESMTKKDPLTVIEDPRKGLAAMNDWDLDPKLKELGYLNSSTDPSAPEVTFARASASKKVCELIQRQKGQLWISGGTATAYWPATNGKLLDESLQVKFDYQ